MSTQAKDTIYIDIDDEITSIIDKVNQSHHKIVALVLPKRAVMLQSVVNMKLLKRAAERASKNIVLITSEHGLMPLAGSVGLHVAKSLQSKPQIPAPPETSSPTEEVVETEKDVPLNPAATIGQLAFGSDDDAVVEVEPVSDSDATDGAEAAEDAATKKKIKIPNFNSFRNRLFLGGALALLLIGGWIWGFIIAPRAIITIKTDTENFSSTLNFTADPATQALDVDNKVVPAVKKEVTKTQTAKVPATGQKNIGEKAKGTMTVYNCTDVDAVVPAGTTFSNSGLSFASQQAVTVPASDFFSNGNCKKNRSASVAVTATQSGDNHNLSAGRDYTSNFGSTLTGTGSAMTGGTTKIVKVVSDADIETAKQQFAAGGDVKEELRAGLSASGMFALTETLESVEPTTVPTPKVGEEAQEVSVVLTVTHTMLGVKEEDIKKLIEPEINSQINTAKQKISDYGLASAVVRVAEKKEDTRKMEVQTVVIVGPQIDAEALKKEIAGKKKGDIEKLILSQPGVKEVKIELKPIWVYSTPKSAKKITINIE